VKHAGPTALAALAPLLAEVRDIAPGVISGVTERRPGTFYARGQALLHFHEDPAGLFADLKVDGDWQRFAVNRPAERATFLAAWRRRVANLKS
jgi:hypothetical protein